jgi:hypothetical protein
MIESTRKRIRRDYEPLTVATTLRCLTPASPVGQVYNSVDKQYEPNRSLTPTTIFPDVRAGAKDGSWAHDSVNELLTSMAWKVNGVDITSLSDWSGLYEITTSGEYKGAITIKRNIPSATRVALTFTAQFADTRLGINIVVVSEDILLTTTDRANDNYSISLDKENDIFYNPVRDELEFYNYNEAHGIENKRTREEIIADGESYIRNIGIIAHRGTETVTDGYTLKMFRIDGTTETEITAGDGCELTSLTLTSLSLDLRIVKKADYALKMYVEDELVSKVQISVDRIYPSIYCVPANGADILPDDKILFNTALVSTDQQKIESPAAIVRILWKVESYQKTLTLNEGETTSIELANTGIGEKEGENWLDIYTEYELKGEYSVATDGDEVLTDENGNVLIFR